MLVLGQDTLNVLQSFGIDPKDFLKASKLYKNIRGELAEKTTTSNDKSIALSTAEDLLTIEQLDAAWEEYITASQEYFLNRFTGVLEELLDMNKEKGPALRLAEKLNELCVVCEKWYFCNETWFCLKTPEKLSMIVLEALDSSSRVMRLLGLQLAFLCAANQTFTQCLFEGGGVGLIGMCFDRENAAELDYALNICTRFLELCEADSEKYPSFPYGWIHRIASLLDIEDPVPNVFPKRRAHTIKIAIKLLRQFPAMATSASLHIILLRYCIQKASITCDEIKNILRVILDIFDNVETRQYIRYDDLDVIYAPFLYLTDNCNTDNINLMNGAKDVLVMLMKTWVGVLWTSSESKGLRALIDILHLPGDLDRKMVLLTLFNKVLCQLAPHRGLTTLDKWQGLAERKQDSSMLEMRETLEGNLANMTSTSQRLVNESCKGHTFHDPILADYVDASDEFVPTTKAVGYHVLDPLLGQVLLLFFYHGLPLALVSMIRNESSSRPLTLAAFSLLQDLLVLMDTVLPVRPVNWLHTALNKAVGRLVREGQFSIGCGVFIRLLQFYKTGKEINFSSAAVTGRDRVNMPFAVMSTYGLGALELENTAFQAMLRDSGVGKAEGFRKWNFDLLIGLVHGPLRELPRFRFVLTETRFFHTLLGFYQPVANSQACTFVSLQPEECTPGLCHFGMVLLDFFLSTREGTEALDRLGFTKAIVSSLEEVINGTPRVLDHQRLGTCVGQTVVRMIGRFSFFANGLVVMKEQNMFEIINSMFEHLSGERVVSPSETDTLQDVCQQLLHSLYLGAVPNYGVCEDIRQTFRLALCNEANMIRLCAATQLRKALWRDLSTSMRWGIETLVQALHDDFYSVVESAFRLLLSICLCSEEALDYLIFLSPTVLMESDVIRNHAKELDLNTLLYCIVSKSSGFRFLQCYGWVEEELRRWEESESANHLRLVERMQAGEPVESFLNFREGISEHWRQRHNRTFSDNFSTFYRSSVLPTSALSSTVQPVSASSGFFPTHFAAVLCKSNEGCTLFKHSSLWQRSLERILQQPLPPDIVCEFCCADDDSDSSQSGDCVDVDDNEKTINEEDLSFWDRIGAKTDDTTSTKCAEERHLQLLRNGRLPCSQEVGSLSAVRDYKSFERSYILECVGDIAELKDAILCVCHASSSDSGFALMRTVPGLQKRLNALMLFGSIVSVRSICLLGECLLARSKRCVELLRGMSRYVLNERNAYTSFDGVPYSVAFSHVKPSKWTLIGRRTHSSNISSAYFAYNQHQKKVEEEKEDYIETEMNCGKRLSPFLVKSKRVRNQVYALSNPVSREGAKAKLYHLMKHEPQLFIDQSMRKFMMNFANTYRMRHAERKFIADILENAPLAKFSSSNRRATILVPAEQGG